MNVITISGKAGTGKDTLARELKKQIEQTNSHKVIIAHFADYLKYICRTFFDWNGYKDDEGRHLLQYVGTDIFRASDENFWVNSLFNVLKNLPQENLIVIIPDARFPNEIELTKQTFPNTLSIKVVRPDYSSALSLENQKHSSETSLDNYTFDFTFTNHEGFDNLKQSVSIFLKGYYYPLKKL